MQEHVHYIRIPNWRDFQHYDPGSRNISWIKLHLKLRQNREYFELTDTQKVHLMSLWMLAVDEENMIATDPAWLDKHNLSKRRIDLQPLLDRGFVELAEAEIQVKDASEGASNGASKPASKPAIPSKNKSKSKKILGANKSRRTDPIWDSLLDELGGNADGMTRSERGRWNRAVKELREAGATPSEIVRRSKVFRSRYPTATLTPTALSAHWGGLAGAKASASYVPPCPNCGMGGGLHLADCKGAAA